MRRALLTFIAVLFIFGGVAASAATISDARSHHANHHVQVREREHPKHEKCDDDRDERSTPPACEDDDDRDNDHDEDHDRDRD